MNANQPKPIHVRHLISGQWIDTPGHDQTIDPYRGDAVARVARGAPEIVERAIASASAAAPTIGYLTQIIPGKGLERLIDAFALVRQRGFHDLGLLVSGSEVSRYATLRRAVHRYGLHKHVRFLGFQSEQTLAVLYRLADIFVIPSLYEGFGLSPLEALASGTPVVASNVSSLPEVLGNAALLVDPYDPTSIATAINRLLDDDDLRADLKRKGYARAQQFSWEQSVRRVLEIYRQVGEGR